MLKSLLRPIILLAIIFVAPNYSFGQTAIFEYKKEGYSKFLPIFINGKLRGFTNQQIELENGKYYVVVQNGKDFYGGNFNKDLENCVFKNLYDSKRFDPHWHQSVNRPSMPPIQTKAVKEDNLSKQANSSDTNNTHTNNNNGNNIRYDYKSNLIVYSKNGKYGYKDKELNIVIKAKYGDAQPFINELNCAIVKKGKKYGIINEANDFLIKPQYDDLDYIHKNHFLIHYYGYGKCIVNQFNDKIIDSYKNEINIHSNCYVCRDYRYGNYYWQIYDQNGNRLKEYCGDSNIECVKNGIIVISSPSRNGTIFWFDNIYNKQNKKNYIEYDEVVELTNNTYLTSIDNKYGFVGIDGKQIIAPVFSHIDTEKWESGEWQYTILEHQEVYGAVHKDIFLMRYDKQTNEAEILSFDQYIDKYGNTWSTLYPTQKALNLSPLNSPYGLKSPHELISKGYAPKNYDTFEESSGEDSFIHGVYKCLDLGDISFKVLKHIVNKQTYLYIIKDNNVCKKIAYSQLADFADLSGAGIDINGISTLSNGDILLKVKANIVTGYDTYMRDPVYINIQGQPVAIDNGGSYRYYNRANVTSIFILDGNTFDLKYSRIMPHKYDNVYVSKYDGFFVCRHKEGYYGDWTEEIEITPEKPLLKFTNSCRDDWSFVPNEGEGIRCICENNEYIYVGGYTKNKGYVGYNNPYICKLDLKSGNIVKSRSYKIKDKSINSFDNGAAIMYQQSFSLLDNFEEGDIKAVSITHNNLTFTGLVYNNEYWIIPPVLPGQDRATYAEWTIYPPEIKYDEDSKKFIQIHSKVENTTNR